jgi:S-adenosylmethionine:tRNA ribosyltransferase-isomerase
MVVEGTSLKHRSFADLIDYVCRDDVIVMNDSKVLPARLTGKKETGGRIEVLLTEYKGEDRWECLIKAKNLREGTHLFFPCSVLEGVVDRRIEGGRFEVVFQPSDSMYDIIHDIGEMPVPPYIKEKLEDKGMYQTVYAREDGSIAAPTAGLHFTRKHLSELRTKGVELLTVTLHVNIGTFLPVRTEDVSNHKMAPEYIRITTEAAEKLNHARTCGRKILAVGTTTLKALESACDDQGQITSFEGKSDLFIYPGHDFKSGITGLVTNFHLPKSTLIMLVSAFAGRDTIMKAYESAVENGYKFYSFGDAMLVMREGNV